MTASIHFNLTSIILPALAPNGMPCLLYLARRLHPTLAISVRAARRKNRFASQVWPRRAS